MGAYILSLRIKTVANCQPADNDYLLKRLEMINNFIGGDKEIIERGMSLIALNMISDYARDIEEDRIFCKYNPVGDGVIDFEEEKQRLIEKIESVECPEMDAIMNIDESIQAYWQR